MTAIDRVLFIGSKMLGLGVLQQMHELSPDTLAGAVTFDDKADTRSALDEIQTYCEVSNIPLHVLKKSDELEGVVEHTIPDLCFVSGWYWLLSERVLDAVPHGFIGMHNSLLPTYRGGAPLVWAMINREKELGFSLFTFTTGMDDGDVWARGIIPLDEYDYIGDILDKLHDKAIEVMRESYLAIVSGTLLPQPQDHSKATYCAQRFPGDGRIDWSCPAQKIYDFIRAQSSPYPGAFTCYKREKLIIWRSHVLPCKYYGIPGQVARITDKGVYIICGDSAALFIEEVERGDGSTVAANSIFKSIKTRLQDEHCD